MGGERWNAGVWERRRWAWEAQVPLGMYICHSRSVLVTFKPVVGGWKARNECGESGDNEKGARGSVGMLAMGVGRVEQVCGRVGKPGHKNRQVRRHWE